MPVLAVVQAEHAVDFAPEASTVTANVSGNPNRSAPFLAEPALAHRRRKEIDTESGESEQSNNSESQV